MIRGPPPSSSGGRGRRMRIVRSALLLLLPLLLPYPVHMPPPPPPLSQRWRPFEGHGIKYTRTTWDEHRNRSCSGESPHPCPLLSNPILLPTSDPQGLLFLPPPTPHTSPSHICITLCHCYRPPLRQSYCESTVRTRRPSSSTTLIDWRERTDMSESTSNRKIEITPPLRDDNNKGW